MTGVVELNAELLRRVREELTLEPCLVFATETYAGRSFHIKVTFPDAIVDKNNIMKRVRAVVDADLQRTPRTVNMLLLVEDDDDIITEEAGADFSEATDGSD